MRLARNVLRCVRRDARRHILRPHTDVSPLRHHRGPEREKREKRVIDLVSLRHILMLHGCQSPTLCRCDALCNACSCVGEATFRMSARVRPADRAALCQSLTIHVFLTKKLKVVQALWICAPPVCKGERLEGLRRSAAQANTCAITYDLQAARLGASTVAHGIISQCTHSASG